MKIVDYETFIRMPAGTIFAPWTPCAMRDDPEIKIDPGRDYNGRWIFNGTCHVVPQPVEGAGFDYEENVESEFWYYDGDSNDAKAYKMFLIFEKQDIENMIKVLEWAKNGCLGTDDPNVMLKGENDANH